MKHYEKLMQAVKDGKFNGFIRAGKLERFLFKHEDVEGVRLLEAEIKASMEVDGIIDEDTKMLLVECSFEALAEKLVADKVFEYGETKIESFDDFFGMLKDII